MADFLLGLARRVLRDSPEIRPEIKPRFAPGLAVGPGLDYTSSLAPAPLDSTATLNSDQFSESHERAGPLVSHAANLARDDYDAPELKDHTGTRNTGRRGQRSVPQPFEDVAWHDEMSLPDASQTSREPVSTMQAQADSKARRGTSADEPLVTQESATLSVPSSVEARLFSTGAEEQLNNVVPREASSVQAEAASRANLLARVRQAEREESVRETTIVPERAVVRPQTRLAERSHEEAAARSSNSAQRGAQPHESQESSAPVVRVSIGRIEVRAVTAQSHAPRPASTPAPRQTLEEYLRTRNSSSNSSRGTG